MQAQVEVKSECLVRLLRDCSGLSALCHMPGLGILVWQGAGSRMIVALVNEAGVSCLTLEFWC